MSKGVREEQNPQRIVSKKIGRFPNLPFEHNRWRNSLMNPVVNFTSCEFVRSSFWILSYLFKRTLTSLKSFVDKKNKMALMAT